MQAQPPAVGWTARVLVIGVIAVIAVIAWFQGSRPSLEISPLVLDMGPVWDGQSLARTVTLKNTSWRTLKIEDIRSDCGCTVPKLAVSELKPGQSVPMEVAFAAPISYKQLDSSKNVALKVSGKVYKLPVKALIRPRVEADTISFDLGVLDKREARTISAELTNKSKAEWSPRIVSKPTGVEVEWKEQEPGRIELLVKVSPTAMLEGAW